MTYRKFSARRSHKLSRFGSFAFLVIILALFIFILMSSDIANSPRLIENTSDPHFEHSNAIPIAIRKDVEVCFMKFSQTATDKSSLVNGTTIPEIQSSTDANKESFSFSVLSNFSNLLSSLNIKGAIIEPAILYCMIQPYYQEILQKRNFNTTDISGSSNIVTYGIFEHNVTTLQQEETIAKFREAGFTPNFVSTPVTDWMRQKGTKPAAHTFISHIFYKSELYTIHVVVFYEKGNYLWHSALESRSRQEIPEKDDAVFINYNGAYEKFKFFSLDSEVLPLSNFSIPSTSHYFLLETLSSRFLECNSSRAGNKDLYSNHPKSHPAMSVENFKSRTHIALDQLKSVFHPMLINFWIWSGTMLGWHRQCDIIPYTSDVDFAAWASEVEDLDRIINLLRNNKHVKIRERMGMLEEALEFNINCHGLRTDVFFLYQIKNGSWCSGHSPRQGYYFRYYYPHFTLCSADLLGEKVLVPCETEKVIEAEYGSEWSKPVSKWNYESSIKNRGPNKYWDKKTLEHAYTIYN